MASNKLNSLKPFAKAINPQATNPINLGQGTVGASKLSESAAQQRLNNSSLTRDITGVSRFSANSQDKIVSHKLIGLDGKEVGDDILSFQRKNPTEKASPVKVDSVTQFLHERDLQRTPGISLRGIESSLIPQKAAIAVGGNLSRQQQVEKQTQTILEQKQEIVKQQQEEKQSRLDSRDVIAKEVPVPVGKSDKSLEMSVLSSVTQDQSTTQAPAQTQDVKTEEPKATNHITIEQIAEALIVHPPLIKNGYANQVKFSKTIFLPDVGSQLYEFYIEVDKTKTEVYKYLLQNFETCNRKKWFGFFIRTLNSKQNNEPNRFPSIVTLNNQIPGNKFSNDKSLYFYFNTNVGNCSPSIDNIVEKKLFIKDNYPSTAAEGLPVDIQNIKVYYKKDKGKIYYSQDAYQNSLAGSEPVGESTNKAVAYEGTLSEEPVVTAEQNIQNESKQIAQGISNDRIVDLTEKQEVVLVGQQANQESAKTVGAIEKGIIGIGGLHVASTNVGGEHQFHIDNTNSQKISSSVLIGATASGALSVGSGALLSGAAAAVGAGSSQGVQTIGGLASDNTQSAINSNIGGYEREFQQMGSIGTTNLGGVNNIVGFKRGISSLESLRAGQTIIAGLDDEGEGVLLFAPPQEQELFGQFRSPIFVKTLPDGSLNPIQPIASRGALNAVRGGGSSGSGSTSNISSGNSAGNANNNRGGSGGSAFGSGGNGGNKPPRRPRLGGLGGLPEKPEDDDGNEETNFDNLEKLGLGYGASNLNGEDTFQLDDEPQSTDEQIYNNGLNSLRDRPESGGRIRIDQDPDGTNAFKNLPERIKNQRLNNINNNPAARARQGQNAFTEKFKNKAYDNIKSKLVNKAFGELKKKIATQVIAGIGSFLSAVVPWILLAALFIGLLMVIVIVPYCKPTTPIAPGVTLSNFRDTFLEPNAWIVQTTGSNKTPTEKAGDIAKLGLSVTPAGVVYNLVSGGSVIPPSDFRKFIESQPFCDPPNSNCAQSGIGDSISGSGSKIGSFDCASKKISVGGTGALPPAALSDDPSISKALFYYLTFINAGETEGLTGSNATSIACKSDINPGGECWGMYQLPKSEVLGLAGNLDACKLYADVFSANINECRTDYLKNPALQAKVQMARLYKRQGSPRSTMSNYFGTNVVKFIEDQGLTYKDGQLPIEHLKEAQKAIDAKDYEKAKKIFRGVDYYDQAFGDRNQCKGDLCRYISREQPVIDYAFANELYQKVKDGCKGSISTLDSSSSSSKVGYLTPHQQDQANNYWSEAFGFPVIAKLGEQIKNPVLTGLQVLDNRILAFNKAMSGKISVEAAADSTVISGTQTQELSVGRIAGTENNVRGGLLKHNDKVIPPEKKVYSPVNGKVLAVENSKPGNFGTAQGADFGNYVGVKISDGEFAGKTYWAGHVGKVLVNKDDNVVVGQTIADMTSWSGSGTGPHWSDMIADESATTMADSQSDVGGSAKLAGLKIVGDGTKATVTFGDGTSTASNGIASSSSTTDPCVCPDGSSGNSPIQYQGEIFTPAVKAFLDTIAKWEAEGGDTLSKESYNSGNYVANDINAEVSTNLSPPFLKSNGKHPTKDEAAFNVGRYQYFGEWQSDPIYTGFKPKSKIGGDVAAANEGLKKAGINFVIKDFKPSSQDYYPIGKYANIASKTSGVEVNLAKALGTGDEPSFKKAVQIGSQEWASMPFFNSSQPKATYDEYLTYFTQRIAVHLKTTSGFNLFKIFGGVKAIAQNVESNEDNAIRQRVASYFEKGEFAQVPSGRSDVDGIRSHYDMNIVKFLDNAYNAGLSIVTGPSSWGRSSGNHIDPSTAIDIWGVGLLSDIKGKEKIKGLKIGTPGGGWAGGQPDTPANNGNTVDPRIRRHVDTPLDDTAKQLFEKLYDIGFASGAGLQFITRPEMLDYLKSKSKTSSGAKLIQTDIDLAKTSGDKFYKNGVGAHFHHFHFNFLYAKDKSFSNYTGSTASTNCANKPCPVPTITPKTPVVPEQNGPFPQEQGETDPNAFLNIFSVIKAGAAGAPSSYSEISPKHLELLAEVAKELKIQKVTDGGGDKPEMKAAFEKLKADAAGKGFTLIFKSGYRSNDSQVQTYFQNGTADKIKEFYAEGMSGADLARVKAGYIKRGESSFPPGYSEHNSGLAVDITASNKPISDNLDRNSYPEDLAKYLAENAPKFGFSLSYPKNSGGASGGAKYEPWHWYFGSKTNNDTNASTSADCNKTAGSTDLGANSTLANANPPKNFILTDETGKVIKQIDGNKAVEGASIFKVIVASVALKKGIDINQQIVLDEKSWLPDETKYKKDQSVPVSKLLFDMLNDSNNTAANALMNQYGGIGGGFDAAAKEAGYSSVAFGNYFRATDNNRPTGDNKSGTRVASAADVNSALVDIFKNAGGGGYDIAKNALSTNPHTFNIPSVKAFKHGNTSKVLSIAGKFEIDGKTYYSVGIYGESGNDQTTQKDPYTFKPNNSIDKFYKDLNKEIPKT